MAVRALVTDSSPNVREAIRRHLETIGCDVVAEAATADQALPLFLTVRPEVVTLGAGLDYDGMPHPAELVKLIKREAPATSVLMLVNGASAEDRAVFLKEGALECVAAPLDDAVFGNLSRKLSDAHPELKTSGFAAKVLFTTARKATRVSTNPTSTNPALR
jgi:DNA-binding response OmpR family regulator